MLALAQLRMQPGGDLDEALALVTRARAGAGDDYRVDIAEGNVRAARGETGLAIAAYTRSLERRRQQPLTLWQRGFEYFKLGKTQEGVVDVVDAIGFDPALCPRLLAYRRHLQNKDAAAAAALEQALPPLPCAP
jgi:lipopolysaccharide biosynthesis regulator YciM